MRVDVSLLTSSEDGIYSSQKQDSGGGTSMVR